MSLNDYIKELDTEQATMEDKKAFERAVGLRFESMDYLRLLGDSDDSCFLIRKYGDFNEFRDYREQAQGAINEAVKLINSDKWQTTELAFDRKKVALLGYSVYYNKICSKVEKNGVIYLILNDRNYGTGNIPKKGLFTSHSKHIENIYKTEITKIYEEIKSHLSGSQQFVRANGLILFKDGSLFQDQRFSSSLPYGLYGTKEVESLNYALARFVRDINKN